MDPAPVANTAAAESREPPHGEKHQSEHVEKSGNESSTTHDSAKPHTKVSDSAASKPGQPEAEKQGRSDAGPPAANAADAPRPGGPSGKTAPEAPAPAASDKAPAVPAAEQRNPKSFVVPALAAAAVVLLIVSVVVSSLIWSGRGGTTASTSGATGATTAWTSAATDSTTSTTHPCPAIPNLSPDAALVTTTVGRLVGSTVSVGGVRLSRWLGVPYAESTAGERRFASPVPPIVSDQCVVVDALKPRPPCAQWVQGSVVGNEDCLRLNIWAPAETASGTAKRGLVLAVTGHWFQRATNDVPQWEELAAQAGVVLISPNVRLGVLGFLHPAIKGFARDVAHEDAMAAIRWAQENAAAFGADPSLLMLVGNGTGGYLLAEAAGRLKVNVSRAVLEGSLYTSAVPANTGALDPSKNLAASLRCNAVDNSTWSACFSNARLELLLNITAAMELRFAPAWDIFVLLGFGGNKKLPGFNDVIGGADIAQARALVDEYIRPMAEANGSASTDDALLTYIVRYLIGNSPFAPSVEQKLKGGSYEDTLVQLAMAVSGCGTRTAANRASRGHHYVVDGGSQPLFEPMLSTADVAKFLADGKVPSLKNGDAWPPSKNISRFLFANGTETTGALKLCAQLGG